MAWFKKNQDPISDRASLLNDQIAELEAQIKKLDSRLQRQGPQPRLRSTARPQGGTLAHTSSDNSRAGQRSPAIHEPIFEEVNQNRLKDNAQPPTTPQHYNELGVRKYDLVALLGRLKNHFRGPATTNPKLVSYLAAGGIQGLRPMRYEKRVARNRFIALALFLFLMLLGIIVVFVRHR